MIAQIFAIIQLVLKLIGLWEQFSQWTIDKATADREERRQTRDAAVAAQQKATDEAEFDKAQDDIARNLPRP